VKLSNILKEIDFEKIIDPDNYGGDIAVSSIHYDTRCVVKDALFVAVKGLVADGHDYIEKAIENGATAIVSEKEIKTNALVIVVKDSRKALSGISDIFYQKPSKDLVLIGITGTNGKTTITYMIESILRSAGIKSGVIGTINYRYDGKIFPNPRTTPESSDLHRILKEMKESCITHVVMEVSSHAIDLNRVDDARFDICLFTNLSQDHLDFHDDMDSYWECKKSLFTNLLQSSGKQKRAVINSLYKEGKELIRELEKTDTSLLSTGTNSDAGLYADQVIMDIEGLSCKIIFSDDQFELNSSVVGNYNLENMLGAAGVAVMLNIPSESIKKGLEAFVVPGRLERVADKNIFVDYAHTPDALENVLITLKEVCKGRLITVFGCGGDRDKTKRPLMGSISCKYSDISIITSDNPRTEEPVSIIDDIVEGIKDGSVKKVQEDGLLNQTEKIFHIEPDRKKSIEKGIGISKPMDIVLIAGKGHETYQEIGNKRFPFDDCVIAKGVI